ncbi:phosphoribosylformylglycinamidine synthase [Leeuwenhoekiella aestuarii]|uniref:Phosphoribosylformylglycinamidine synthase n=1 Tax=Leeuwenhoekiella aestuarii TaxID=2249426 RepID=A0A4Q0NWG2_9FLAO|nr:phosphoribosylformylglycinamidine synthase [Leeuwenhoekiella aestuarii]RXG15559.1 phosphoribosylformylglycinamidine synthase [Leeuwenhoekiella aestuarii]RXG17334.1 phosphoribosylformylglycinamidine synthase [Leeuwenhoekiella aestuarii]
MIHFFGSQDSKIYAVQATAELSEETTNKLIWLFGNQPKIQASAIDAFFIGPRATMITPWSTNAVEITQNMGVEGIIRIEEFVAGEAEFDPMLSQEYTKLDQEIFTINIQPEAIKAIEDIQAYNKQEGLALNEEEVAYLKGVAARIGRPLTDSEVFGFSQVNSEHCRHKIFNGTFVIDGKTMPSSLFKMIRKTSEENPNEIVSAYKDNVAFIKGPKATQFAPETADKPDFYTEKEFESVLSLKAETHNFPTTVEPFNGAATGAGGEIRDRLAGGQGSLPLAGTAVYMTAYSRLKEDRPWEDAMPARKWLYQTPIDILIKASNGASDFGNKFGQPLIAGSVLTFEHDEAGRKLGFDKVIMQAGGIGYGKKEQALKEKPETGDKIVILGGDNYRIGMGGAAVSSADTGAFSSGIELNAIQRSNPEMQKRAANAIRGMVESDENTIVSIHDHGAGGHLNCLSELVEETGGLIDLDKLPVGDPTLSAKEIIGNESQERMGLVIGANQLKTLKAISDRERSPIYEVGDVTGDHRFTFKSATTGAAPMDLAMDDMFGSSPKTVMVDSKIHRIYSDVSYSLENFHEYLENVLQLEAVASKDWLTNKVDRCVGGRVAKQQCVGSLQIPLNNVGVMALDFKSKNGIATSIGHSPVSGLIDPVAGSKNSIAEALTNLVWAPLEKGLKSVSLSANWMWPCNNVGEDARLYEAVEAVSEFAIDLGINVPTGKDSLSMKQKYPEGDVLAPGTVIISAAGNCSDINRVVEPVLNTDAGSIYYLNLSQDGFKLGGSSFAQIQNKVGMESPSIKNNAAFGKTFDLVQNLIKSDLIAAGHDVASGGLITTLLELCFAENKLGASVDFSAFAEQDIIKILFAENTGIVIQATDDTAVENAFAENDIQFYKLGTATNSDELLIKQGSVEIGLNIPSLRRKWFETSYLLDQKQTANNLAEDRYQNFDKQDLKFEFPKHFTGIKPAIDTSKPRPKAAILREKGSNSEREMANAMYLAGFDVKDVHMTDLISGRETLEDIQFIGAVGGFSNSDVLGSAKGWAGAFLYNEKANTALKKFFARPDTLSVGICNGCQLFVELDLINPEHDQKPKMLHNDSHKHESGFTSVKIEKNDSVMLSTLEGASLGVWISHGEGKFELPLSEKHYNIIAKYGYDAYPANPNGSSYNTAMMTDKTGRHLVTMPHIERSIFQWNWANYPKGRKDEVSPWIEAFENARKWIEKKKN